MNILTLAVPILLSATVVVAAPTLMWDASVGAEGYRMYCGPTPIATAPVPIDVGTPTTLDMAGTLTIGTEYECWVTAYAGEMESADSNHLKVVAEEPWITVVAPRSVKGFRVTWE